MVDYLIRAITVNKEIRALAVRSTEVVEKARKAHQTTPVVTAALGRLLTGTLLVGSMLKSGDETGIIIEGNGPIKKMIAESNQYGEVRGYALNPHLDLMLNNKEKLDVARAVGTGTLRVKKIIGLKEPYEGSVPLISGEIGDDLTYYFTQSEQTPSAVGLGVLVEKDLSVKAAGGFIIQLLPGATEDTIGKLEKNIAQIKSVSSLIEEGKNPEELLDLLLDGLRYRVLNKKNVAYKCKCSRERTEKLLNAFDKNELEDIIRTEGKVEVKCHFCNKSYVYNEDEIRELINKKGE